MYSIEIDIPESLLKMSSDEGIQMMTSNLLNALVLRYREILESKVSAVLNTTRQTYLQAIKVDYPRNDTAVIFLDESQWLPNALESGVSGFDMKEQFLSSPNAKTSKSGGKYVNIPFDFGTPQKTGKSRPSFYKKNTLPNEVYKEAKALKPSGRLVKDKLPLNFQKPYSHVSDNSKVKNTHKHSIYEDLVVKTDAITNEGSYTSFRRVSSNSLEDSWTHPGLEKRDFLGRSLQDFSKDTQSIVDEVVSNFLRF